MVVTEQTPGRTPPGTISASRRDTIPSPPDHVQPLTLYAGQLFAEHAPHVVTTILGSCVSVCVWDGRLAIGGINHFMLPHWSAASADAGLRYGNVATLKLIRMLESLGAQTRTMTAKIFGGACVVAELKGREGNLGERNIAIARTILAAEGIPIVASDVGGSRGRKLVFHSADGVAWVKPIGQ